MNEDSVQPGGMSRPPTMQTPIAPRPKPKTSGMAIASVICGVLGMCLFIPSLIGVVLGILSLSQIKNSNGEKGGQSVAIAGIVVSGVSVLIFLFAALMAGIMLPAIGVAREAAMQAKALAMAQGVLSGAMTYENDMEVLPTADNWIFDIYGVEPEEIRDDLPNIAMNRHVGGMRLDEISDPTATVMFFEMGPDSELMSGDAGDLPPTPKHPHGYLIIFVEGGPRFVPPEELDTLVWEP